VLKRGFPASTLRVVAREAKVPLSFVHYYFRDKDDLMRCVAERILARAIERFEQARGSERDPLRAAHAVLQECTWRSARKASSVSDRVRIARWVEAEILRLKRLGLSFDAIAEQMRHGCQEPRNQRKERNDELN